MGKDRISGNWGVLNLHWFFFNKKPHIFDDNRHSVQGEGEIRTIKKVLPYHSPHLQTINRPMSFRSVWQNILYSFARNEGLFYFLGVDGNRDPAIVSQIRTSMLLQSTQLSKRRLWWVQSGIQAENGGRNTKWVHFCAGDHMGNHQQTVWRQSNYSLKRKYLRFEGVWEKDEVFRVTDKQFKKHRLK